MRALRQAAVAISMLAPLALGAEPIDELRPRVIRSTVEPVVRARSAALLVSGMTGGDLDVTALALAVPDDGSGTTAVVLVDVDLESFVIEAAETAQLEAIVYALAGDAAVTTTKASGFALDLEDDVGGLQIAVPLALKPGSYTIRVLVRERLSGALALAGVGLRLPNAGAIAAWLSRPSASWVVGVAATQPLPDWLTAEHVASSEPRLPAAGVEVRPGDQIPGRLLLRSAGGGEPAVGAQIFSAGVRATDELAVSVGVGETVAPGLAIHSLSFDAPILPPGDYLLRFVAGSDARPAGASQEIPFAVLPAGPLLEDENAADAPASDSKSTGRSTRATERRYREILATLAAGDQLRAAAGLRRFEAEMYDNLGSRGLLRVSKVKQSTITDLAKRSPKALLAVLGLHAASHEGYDAGGAAALETHSMRLILRLAESLERRAAAADRPRAAKELAAVGALFQRTGWIAPSDRLFELALALDDGSEMALLCAAANREKAEEYPAAVSLLQALMEIAPEHEEARLRLAVNLARVGESARAIDLLRRLGREAESEWVSVLAFQELARLESHASAEMAIASLRQGLARWPDEQGLVLQLAQLSATGSTGPTIDILRPLIQRTQAGAAPRQRYNRWPRVATGGDPHVASDFSEEYRRLAGWLEETAKGRR